MLDAINNVFRKFSAFHDETGRLNVDGMNIISNDGSNKLNRSRKARVSYKVQRTINASLNAATSTRAVSSNPNFVTRHQMDNRIKLLEEILSFRMQGVEFDNGDMYVDGHKAASDVRDEFVSVTEKLMDELAQCYNVLPQLDINNTIDHRPEGDEKWFLENEKTVTQFCRKLAAERPLKDI